MDSYSTAFTLPRQQRAGPPRRVCTRTAIRVLMGRTALVMHTVLGTEDRASMADTRGRNCTAATMRLGICMARAAVGVVDLSLPVPVPVGQGRIGLRRRMGRVRPLCSRACTRRLMAMRKLDSTRAIFGERLGTCQTNRPPVCNTHSTPRAFRTMRSRCSTSTRTTPLGSRTMRRR